MSQLMNHFYYCRQIIDNKTPNPHKIAQFRLHINNMVQASHHEDINSKKTEQLLPIILKDLIVKHDEDFQSMFEILVEKGVNLNFVEKKDEKCLLMIACADGSAETVRCMLANGAKTSHTDLRKQSCLFYALENKGGAGLEILKMLLNADETLVNSPSNNNKTILFAAVEKGKSQYVKLLLEKGAKPNEAISDQLDTPLHQIFRNLKNQKREFVKNELRQMVKLLLRYDANYGLKNKQGKTAMEIDPNHEEYMLTQVQIVEEGRKEGRGGQSGLDKKQAKETKDIKIIKETDQESNTRLPQPQKNEKQNDLKYTKMSRKKSGKVPETVKDPKTNPKEKLNNKESPKLKSKQQQKQKQKPKQKPKPKPKLTSTQLRAQISRLKQTIQTLQHSISTIPPPVPLAFPQLPLHKLTLNDQYLSPYLTSQMLLFSEKIDKKKQKLKGLVDKVLQTVKEKLGEMNVSVHVFGSQATGLGVIGSDLNIAVVPGGEMGVEQRVPLMGTVESHLRETKLLQGIKFDKVGLVIDAVGRQSGVEIAVQVKYNQHFQVEQGRIQLIEQYKLKFPQLRHMVYVLKCLLRSINLHRPSFGGLDTYALVILLTAFIKSQKESLQNPDQELSCGTLLLSFLNNFGYEFDYIDKGIFLSFMEKGYIYNLDLKSIPKLVISDPLNQHTDIGVQIPFTKLLRNLFRISYFTLRVNHVCYGACEVREKIDVKVEGDEIQPCCILKRLFRRYNVPELRLD